MPPGGIADRSLEQADRIRNLDRLAIVLRHGDGEKARIGRAIDAAAQRAHQIAKTIFAAVHIGPPVPALVRVHIGDEDLRQMHLVGDRAPAPAVARFDHREHGPRPHVGAQVKAPDVPDVAAVLARDVVPAGLGKVGRPHFRPQRAAPGDFGLFVTPGLGGDRHHAGIGDIDRLAGFQIDGGKQAFDWPGPHIGVAWLGVARHFQEALTCFLGAKISRRERQAKHPTGGETALRQTLDHARIRQRHAARAHHLTEQQIRLARGRLPGGGAAGREINGRLMYRPRLAHHGNGAPRQARARPPCRNRRLVGLIEVDAVKPRLRPELAFAGENGLDPTKLSAGQRVERMRRLGLLG